MKPQGEKRRQQEPGRCFTWLVEEAAQLVLHVRLPLLQVLLLEAAREGDMAGTRCQAPERQSIIPKLGVTSGRTEPSPTRAQPRLLEAFLRSVLSIFGHFWLLALLPLLLQALQFWQDSPRHRRCPLPRTHTRAYM